MKRNKYVRFVLTIAIGVPLPVPSPMGDRRDRQVVCIYVRYKFQLQNKDHETYDTDEIKKD